jgi:Holliday junction DNA helicase RuvB
MNTSKLSIKDKLYKTLSNIMGYNVEQETVNRNTTTRKKTVKKVETMPVTQEREVNHMDFRPKTFDQIIGQEEVKENLKLKIAAFKKTNKSVVHMLFLGFSGVGKTTMANAVANEMGVNFHQIMATRIKTWADFYNILKDVEENDIIFIDEIHALDRKIQEQLYGVMEDFTCTIEDKNLNRVRLVKINRFTMIGATTHTGKLNDALINRFQYKCQLLPYTHLELSKMVQTAGERIYNVDVPEEIALRLAQLSRKTARVAYNLLRTFMDTAEASTPGRVRSDMLTKDLMYKTLKLEQIDPIVGLDYASRKYLITLLREEKALGSRSIASMINEQESTVLNTIEPFLLSDIKLEFQKQGQIVESVKPFIKITPKGRISTESAYHYIKLCQNLQAQGWFPNESLTIK